ncbi:MAG: inositol monophosphatase [Candidatus Eisenbacteria bacterium]|uniref:Inositol-1-monophosphatase n=1 Tax=Eiseniibacteriota bacterium TaxID=2212470 RepID=A0A538UE16_UNCEI|nr:MAG: inositol monophosphatase [Candidatus Eisenbacteria bacterium]
MSAPAPRELREAAVEFARAAGAVLREGYGRAHRPERKGRIDLVTEYDRRSERLLLDAIAARFPGHAVLAEESGASAPGERAAPVRWLVDPLDGTTNFAHNYPFFCVSVAAEVAGVLVAGAVYDPVRDEMFAAAAGEGATLAGMRLRVSDIARVEDALIVTGFPYAVREHPEATLPHFEAFLMRAQGIRRDGSAALNLCYLAAGRFDGMWESDLSPWDMAAGVLMAREAGGIVTGYAGQEFVLDHRELLASNGRIHEEMKGILAGTRTAR